jgi:hypothetical protein
MEKEKLTLENFKEVALSLLKEENGGDMTLDLIWDQGASLDKEGIKKAKKLMEEIGSTKIEDGVYEYLYDLNFSTLEEIKDDLVEKVVRKYSDYDEYSDEYEELQVSLGDIVDDYFNIDLNEKQIIENTNIEELDIFLISNNETALEDEIDLINDFSNYKALQAGLEDVGNFQPLVFLIQSQGYEVEDLYDKEKVENSKFLKSLQTELNELPDGEGGSIVFSKINVNLEKALNIEQSNENIIIPKDGMYVGIHNVVLGYGSLLDVKLEKDIILNRENARVMSDVSEKREGYLIQETFGLIDTEPNVNFKLTNEKGFEMHDVNVEKVLEKAKEYFAEEKNENEYDFD